MIWRRHALVHGARREVQCTFDHLGEGLFELRLRPLGGQDLVHETFQDPRALLARALELRDMTRTDAGGGIE